MTTINDIIDLTLAQRGVPYVFGGINLKDQPHPGVDCSGLFYAVCERFGVTIPRTSEAQWAGLPRIDVAQVRSGDLVLFDVPSDNQAQPAHVGMVYQHLGQMIQAAHTGTVVSIDAYADHMDWGSVMGYVRLPFPDSAPTPSTPKEPINMLCNDPESGGVWAVDLRDGHVEAVDGAPWLGGFNEHPDWHTFQIGSVAGIAADKINGQWGYAIAVSTPKANPDGSWFDWYRFPRSGTSR